MTTVFVFFGRVRMETIEFKLSDVTKITLIAGSGICIRQSATIERPEMKQRLSVKECLKLEATFPEVFAEWKKMDSDIRNSQVLAIWHPGIRKRISNQIALSFDGVDRNYNDDDDDDDYDGEEWTCVDDFYAVSLISTWKERRNFHPHRIVFSEEELIRFNEKLPEICKLIQSCYSVLPEHLVQRPTLPPSTVQQREQHFGQWFADYDFDFH